MSHDWTMEPPDTRWFGRAANPGWASKLTWATTRRPTTQRAPLSQGRWNRVHEDRQCRSRSRSSRTPKPLSDGWPRRSLAPARSTRFRQGSTSPCYGKPGRTSPPRSGGCPARRGVPGDEKADEWAKLAAEEPDSRGVEWLGCADRLDRSRTRSGRSRRKKKWADARQWAGGRTSEKKHRMPKSQGLDGTVAGGSKRLASRLYQIKTGQYLQRTKNRPTAQCGWRRGQTQTRDHLFKVCPEWNGQQNILWAEVLKETGRRKHRFTVRDLRDLLANGRCSQAVLDSLSTTDVGRLVPAEEDGGSEVSEWERRERGYFFLCSFLFVRTLSLSFAISLGRHIFL